MKRQVTELELEVSKLVGEYIAKTDKDKKYRQAKNITRDMIDKAIQWHLSQKPIAIPSASTNDERCKN